MANRTGIELLPYVCRIVEIQTGGGLFRGGRSRSGSTSVRTVHEIPYPAGGPGFLTGELRQVMKGLERRATVAVWGLQSRHDALLLPPASPADLEVMARREVRAHAAVGASEQAADGIVIGDLREDGRREVGYVSVRPEEMRQRLKPLVDAGFQIAAAVTPALAHAVIVRQRGASSPDEVTAVLSVNGRATALTVLRGSLVLFAREMPWGHETERAESSGAGYDPARFAASLASELRRSLVFLKQNHKVDVSRVLLCGDVPDMRSLTGPLMSELNVEVETLDSLEGLNLSRLPEPPAEFRSRPGALRTAWALAADSAPPVNLVPREVTPVRFNPQLQRRYLAAAATGVLIAVAGWGLLSLLNSSVRADQDRLRRQLGLLEPQMQRLSDARRESDLAAARLTALRAFASQGPRLARVLEVFGRATPAEAAITTIRVDPKTGSWIVTVEGQAEGTTAAAAHLTFNRFLRAVQESPLLGDPIKPPAMSVRTSDPVVEPVAAIAEVEPVQPWLLEPWERERRPTVAAFTEVIRNGRLYRIPVSRQQFEAAERERRRLEEEDQLARARLRPTTRLRAEPEKPQGRHPGALLEFSVQYEVRK